MNAAVVQSFDAPPIFTTFEDPTPGADELLIKVTAAGLHPIVKALARGAHYGSTGKLPFIPGVDGVGKLPDGTRVYFGASHFPFGSLAERIITAANFTLKLPDGMDDATAAALANPGMSSWTALKFRAQFVSGESVLILGATGVAGQLSVQIAKRLGARRIVACGRNPEALEELKSLGADEIISLNQPHETLVTAFRREIAEFGVNVVLDYLWGHPAETVLAAISQKGLSHASSRIRFIQIGGSAAPTITLAAATLRSSGVELLGSGFGSASMDEIFKAVADFFSAATKDPFKIEVKTAPLRDAEKLWTSPEHGFRLVFQP
jgi:NADPH:quinone reductase-like Zn-dependent oxidoreductase